MAGDSDRPGKLAIATPAFIMQHAATPPMYASPARAAFPSERPVDVKTVSDETEARRKDVPALTDALPPAPEVTQAARLIVAAVLWWTVVAGLVALSVCTYAYVTHAPPEVPAACIVTPGQECVIQSQSGASIAYWVEWQQAPGLATMTPTTKAGNH